jgi:hypothetical protein
MSKIAYWIMGAIVLLILVGGVIWYYASPEAPAPVPETPVIDTAPESEATGDFITQIDEEPVAATSTPTTLETMLRNAIAAFENVSVDAVHIVSITERQWPDGCLGLGGKGDLCTQAIVPGYEVVATVNGETRTYRTNQDGTVIRRAL